MEHYQPKSESEVQQLIQIEGPKYHSILLRNNSGALTDNEGRLVRYGLGNVSKQQNETLKSSDLIGITTIIVTADMVGKAIAVFTAVEVKSEGWTFKKTKREIAQQNFINWVKSRGGIAGFASSVTDYVDILKNK